MRAVNLIPSDQQRGAGGAAGRSNGGAYILLGVLALLVAMAAAYVHSGGSVKDKQSELASVNQQAAAAEATASSLTGYTKFAAVRAKRVETVSQLAASRFDWSHALHEVARVLPDNAWLSQMTATTSPSVSVGGQGGTLRQALNVPAIVVQGCTTGQSSVAELMARLRLIDGVERVSLEDSTKGQMMPKTSGSTVTAIAGGSSGDCRGGHANFPIFNVDVFFAQTSTVPSSNSGTGTTTTASATSGASSSSPASTATPASTSVPSSGGTTP